MTQPTTYRFSSNLFKKIRECTPAVRIVQLEKELEHLRNKIRGHKAFQTKLIRQNKN